MSLIALISDVHGNLEALRAVLKDVEEQKADFIYSLGDIVGYGANPRECVDLIKKNCKHSLRGNHEDAVLSEFESLPDYREEAASSILLARRLLQPSWLVSRNLGRQLYLKSLPSNCEEGKAMFVHGSPRDEVHEYLSSGDIIILNLNSLFLPDEMRDAYLDEPEEYEKDMSEAFLKLKENFSIMRDASKDVCFNGHNHVPGILMDVRGRYELVEKARRGRHKIKFLDGREVFADEFVEDYALIHTTSIHDKPFQLGGEKTVVNVGSVGQPRNCDPRASYFLFDEKSREILCRRVTYDIKAAADKIRANGFPNLARRLFEGN